MKGGHKAHAEHHDGRHGGHHGRGGGHKGHHHGRKAGGGRIGNWTEGDPVVEREAEGREDYAKGDERKRGGKVHGKHHGGHHGKEHRASGGKVIGLMTGGAARPRLDRPGRKRGGAVGADRSPLSSAHRGHKDGHETPDSRDTYGGTPP